MSLATEITPLWKFTEAALEETGIEPPFWAFAWAGGQGLARYVLDHPDVVRGRSVIDFGAGSGLVALAAARAGAARVRAIDIDPMAAEAMRLNADRNGLAIEIETGDIIGSVPNASVILIGDLCYERPLAERLLRWLRDAAGKGVTVLIGDPGRTYQPTEGIERLASYVVPTSLELEDRLERDAVVWRLTG